MPTIQAQAQTASITYRPQPIARASQLRISGNINPAAAPAPRFFPESPRSVMDFDRNTRPTTPMEGAPLMPMF